MVTNDWRIWLAAMIFTLVLLAFFFFYIWWNERETERTRKNNGRAFSYRKEDGYYLCVFLKDGGCNLHRALDVKQVISSESKDYFNVVLRDGDVTHYEEDAVSYEFKHIIDLAQYNLKTVKRVTE